MVTQHVLGWELDGGFSHTTSSIFGQVLQAADASQTPLLATTTSRRRKMLNIQLFWREGMPHSSSTYSTGPSRSSPFLGLPSSINHNPGSAVPQWLLFAWVQRNVYFGMCQRQKGMGALGWGGGRRAGCFFRYAKICISLATTLHWVIACTRHF